MSRLYVVESTPTTTGAVADHRFSVKPSDMGRFVGSIMDHSFGNQFATVARQSMEPIFNDLAKGIGSSIVIAGEDQPAILHWLAHFWNGSLGNVGKTVFYTDP